MRVRLFSWLTALAASSAAFSQFTVGGDFDACDTPDRAWAMGQPRVIATGVERFEWSKDGRHVIYIERQMRDSFSLEEAKKNIANSTCDIWAYDFNASKAVRLAKLPLGSTVDQITWLGDGTVGLAEVHTAQADPAMGELVVTQSLYRLNVRQASSSLVVQLKNPMRLFTMLTPSGSRLLITDWNSLDSTTGYMVYDVEKGPINVRNAPPASGGWSPQVWVNDNTLLWYRFRAEGADFLQHNIETGATEIVPRERVTEMLIRPEQEETSQPTLSVAPASAGIPSLLRKEKSPAWMLMAFPQGLSPMAIVTPSAEAASLRPESSNSVAFLSDGTLYLRAIKPVDRKMLIEVLSTRESAELMSRAKQVGTAIMIFGADNDDDWPNGNIEDLIEPYVRNRSLFEGMVFNLPRGKMTDLESPAETPIGHIDGRFGRATLYADGHVKWVPATGR